MLTTHSSNKFTQRTNRVYTLLSSKNDRFDDICHLRYDILQRNVYGDAQSQVHHYERSVSLIFRSVTTTLLDENRMIFICSDAAGALRHEWRRAHTVSVIYIHRRKCVSIVITHQASSKKKKQSVPSLLRARVRAAIVVSSSSPQLFSPHRLALTPPN